jgi:two-component system sensor histidine kinase DctS
MALADKILIEQVLLNLTRNAIEAMADSSTQRRLLRIVSSIKTIGIKQSGHTATFKNEAPHNLANQQVIIQVIDQGHGIAPEVGQQLFTPFFSTKPTGMGMGLNICRTAIEFHGGRLYYQANPNGGIIFAFSLPLATPISTENFH